MSQNDVCRICAHEVVTYLGNEVCIGCSAAPPDCRCNYPGMASTDVDLSRLEDASMPWRWWGC